MRLKELHIAGFKSFAKKTALSFDAPITAIVGPNGSGKSNVAESFRFALGEQSMKAMRGKRGDDLIWDGSRTLPKGSRASVKVVFDNRAHASHEGAEAGSRERVLDFDEIAIERTVFRDASNEYLVNGTKVRLKDVQELLAGAEVGGSGHHIISQGEADRILLSSPKDRKASLEEALGLRLYHIRKAEAEKKRAETAANRKEAAALRREIAPHLSFLKKQVERAHEAETLKETLVARFRAYFAGEVATLRLEREQIAGEKHAAAERIARIRAEHVAGEAATSAEESGAEGKELARIDGLLRSLAGEREEGARALGRLEGKLAASEEAPTPAVSLVVPREEVTTFLEALDRELDRAGSADDVTMFRHLVAAIRRSSKAFLDRLSHTPAIVASAHDAGRSAIIAERDALLKTHAEAAAREQALREERTAIEREAAFERSRFRERERARLGRESALREAERAASDAAARQSVHAEAEAALKREEAQTAIAYGRGVIPEADEGAPTTGQERQERLRELDRLKARFEAIDPGASDAVVSEYEATKQRDEFLARELSDLEQTDTSLSALIRDLDAELARQFAEGVRATSERFHELFSLMFDGGKASLVLTRPRAKAAAEGVEVDEEALETGIEIEVAMPRKKTKGLHALSGGERALTAIALTFAIAQVNPPPFLILDETDAALDEANSRRYGDMIERIADHSQLILITHNRETMSRAGILYGITMGADGASEILSVKLDEALAVAK